MLERTFDLDLRLVQPPEGRQGDGEKMPSVGEARLVAELGERFDRLPA